jgi:hypothetical protein
VYSRLAACQVRSCTNSAVVGHGPRQPVAVGPAGYPFQAQGLHPHQVGASGQGDREVLLPGVAPGADPACSRWTTWVLGTNPGSRHIDRARFGVRVTIGGHRASSSRAQRCSPCLR